MPLNLCLRPWGEAILTAVAFGLLAGLLTGCGGGESQARAPAPAVPPEVRGPDPLLSQQWHLFNTGQAGGLPDMDLGLQGVAETGRGVLIAFVDGAVQIGHPDLVANLQTVNGLLTTPDPTPPSAPAQAPYNDRAGEWDDAHGTAVVGIAVARADNSIGGRGAVVVFAAGNGGADDDSNRDGYASQPGVLAVGAVDHRGRPPAWPPMLWARPR